MSIVGIFEVFGDIKEEVWDFVEDEKRNAKEIYLLGVKILKKNSEGISLISKNQIKKECKFVVNSQSSIKKYSIKLSD